MEGLLLRGSRGRERQLTSTPDRCRFVVGITDHMRGGPEVEAEILASIVEVDFFDTREEGAFDAERLSRIDALLV